MGLNPLPYPILFSTHTWKCKLHLWVTAYWCIPEAEILATPIYLRSSEHGIFCSDGHFGHTKRSKNRCHQSNQTRLLGLKNYQNCFCCRSSDAPDPTAGALPRTLQCSPDSLDGFKGPHGKGKGKGKGRGREEDGGREREGFPLKSALDPPVRGDLLHHF